MPRWEPGPERKSYLRQMSHDLKTPLATVREGAALLVDGAVGALTPQQREVAEILQRNTVELHLMIENLFAYEDWREKGGRISRSRFALRPIVERCLGRYGFVTSSRRLKVEL